MKYNKSEIMKSAWTKYKTAQKWTNASDWTFSRCLKAAWADAKKAIREATESKGEKKMKEDVINLIRRYGLTPVDLDTAEPKICVRRPAPKADQPAMIEAIKSAKPEIIAYWRAQEEARKQETREKKEAIRRLCPGMDELAACARSWAEWHEAEQAAFEGPDGVISLPPMPAVKYSDLAAKYPTAAAYRHAEAYSRAENYRKAAAGREAMRSILAGEDVQAALEKMENWLPADAIWD